MSTSEDVAAKLAELRNAFDQSFATLPPSETTAFESLLAIRVGKDPFALRVGDTAGLALLPPTLALPSQPPELLGLAGIRGRLLPVYSLALLLGYARTDERWLVISERDEPVGLAFSAFEGHFRAARTELVAGSPGDGLSLHVTEFLPGAAGIRGVLSVASVLAEIVRRVGLRARKSSW